MERLTSKQKIDPNLKILENTPLKPLTTIGTGGPARFFLACASNEDIIQGLQFAKSRDLKVLVLGGGSNVLISDDGFQGLVLHVATRGVSFDSGGRVTASAGVKWSEFVQSCIDRELSGVETLAGIPGLVGATPIQNVGAYGQEVANVIEAVQTIEKSTLIPRTFSAKDCRFGYRQSRFKADDLDKFIITSVTFRLSQTQEPEPRYEELKASLGLDPAWQTATRSQRLNLMSAHVTKIRASKGMVIDPRDPDTKSVGSFFMNPVVPQPLKEKVEGIAAAEKLVRPFVAHHVGNNLWKLSAAWLIENSGINKGQILAGARVSTKHVLALTNPGHASTEDILNFADFITTKVEQKFGVRLEREPVVVP